MIQHVATTRRFVPLHMYVRAQIGAAAVTMSLFSDTFEGKHTAPVLLAQQRLRTEGQLQAGWKWGRRSYTPLCLLHGSSSQNMHLAIFETEHMNKKVFHLLDWLDHLQPISGNKGFELIPEKKDVVTALV